MRVAKLLGKLLLGLLTLVVLVYLAAIAINWRDQPPSAAARILDRVIADRPAVSDGENAYVYMLGFAAPEAEDPFKVGARRRAWVETPSPDESHRGADPLKSPVEFTASLPNDLQHMKAACMEQDRKACAEEFEAVARHWQPTERDALALARYEKLLTLRSWRETQPLDLDKPLPPYGDVVHAQRITYLRLRQLASAGEVTEIARFLRADFAFWRNTLPAVHGLIDRMIAVAALRNHFFFANLILRQLPAEVAMNAVPPEWALEFSAQDRSMLKVIAGEQSFFESTLRKDESGDEISFSAAEDEPLRRTFSGHVLSKLARPLFQAQEYTNDHAARLLEFVTAFDVPMNRYQQAARELKRYGDRRESLHIYNFTGELMLRMYGATSYIEYAFRGAGVEGMRRAALLTAQLRGRGVPADKVPGELLRAELLDPYSGEPFQWSVDHQSVMFIGPEDHAWHRQEYFY